LILQSVLDDSPIVKSKRDRRNFDEHSVLHPIPKQLRLSLIRILRKKSSSKKNKGEVIEASFALFFTEER
jgi:hypothetical protein